MFSQTGLVLSVHERLATGGAWRFNLLRQVSGWTHTIAADGGYQSARLTMQEPQPDLEEWLDMGLGRHLILYNSGGRRVFEGFVNTVNVNLGGLAVKVGPLMDVVNSTFAVYSTVDTSISPPAVGVREKTATTTHAASIAKYGTLQRPISIGGCTAANALQIRNMYLAENAYPETTQVVTPGSGTGPSITLDILGYSAWLDTYLYNAIATGTVTARQRIINVLAASPTISFTTVYDNMDANATAIPAYTNDDKTASDLIRSAVATGDPSDYSRYTFGIYANRYPWYKKIPSSVEYIYRISEGSQQIKNSVGVPVDPWDALPAQWLQLPDYLVGRIPTTSDIKEDPRNLFIETVTYTAPWSLTINGGKVVTLKQKLAQLGLGGT